MGKCFEQDDVFPVIRRIIQEKHVETVRNLTQIQRDLSSLEGMRFQTKIMREGMDFITHDLLVSYLSNDQEGKRIIANARRRCPEHSEEWLTDSMIQWWSQRFTVQKNEYSHGIERRKISDSWAYRPCK